MDYVRIYFPNNDQMNSLIDAFYRTITKKINEGTVTLEEIEQGLEVDTFYLEEHLEEITSAGIDHLRAALSRIIEEKKNILQKTYIKIVPFPEPVPFSSLRHKSVGKLFSVVGIVSRIESSKPVPVSMIFSCNKCSAEIESRIVQGVFDKPEICLSPCKSKSFTLLKRSEKNTFRDYQRIKIQELFLTEIERRKAGSVNCIVERSFVNTLLPGDAVHILGTGIAESSGEDGYTVGIKVNNILFLKQKDTQNQFMFLPDDVKKIKDVARSKNPIALLSASLFPDVVGNEEIKKGVLLSLVGGAYKKNKRKELHTVIIGDPGMGKSKLLRKASEVLSRSNYICGATSTTGGLGLTMQTNSAGEFVMAAGALVLSDLGHCFIDELDKLESPQVLFEVMESEEITIAKAGMVCAMPARTAVVAAANPLHGRYRQDKTLQENINLPGEFLSRFDMIFIMIDEETTEEHWSIARHILGKDEEEECPEGVPIEIAQKYIQYAREQVNPVLSSGAKEAVIEFFKTIRREKNYRKRVLPQPFTPRIIDSVVRTAEALAKLSLRSIATKADVEQAIEILTVEQKQKTEIAKKRQPPHLLLIQKIREARASEITEKEIRVLGERLGLTRECADRLIYRFNTEGLLIQKGRGIYKVCL